VSAILAIVVLVPAIVIVEALRLLGPRAPRAQARRT